MLQKFGEKRVSIFLLLDRWPRSGKLPWGYFVLFPSRVSRKSDGVLRKLATTSWGGLLVRKALSNDAGFLKTEIAAPAQCRRTDDDVVHQLEQQDPAGFENPPGEPQIGFGRGGITGGMIVHQDEGIFGVCDH